MLEAQQQLTKLTEQLDATSKNKQDLDGRLKRLDDRVSHIIVQEPCIFGALVKVDSSLEKKGTIQNTQFSFHDLTINKLDTKNIQTMISVACCRLQYLSNLLGLWSTGPQQYTDSKFECVCERQSNGVQQYTYCQFKCI